MWAHVVMYGEFNLNMKSCLTLGQVYFLVWLPVRRGSYRSVGGWGDRQWS